MLIEKTPIMVAFSKEITINGFKVGDTVYANPAPLSGGVVDGKGRIVKRALREHFRRARILEMGYYTPTNSIAFTVEWQRDGEPPLKYTGFPIAIPQQRVLVIGWR
jgi:hypothetical protein